MNMFRRLSILSLALVVMFTVPMLAESMSVSPDTVISMLEITFSVIDCDYDIDGNSSGFVIQFSSEDYSYMYLMSLLFGNDETDKIMEEVAASTVELCSSLRKNIESLGLKNPNLTLILTDYTEKDYIFLIVCNGQIVYDMLAD